MWGSLPQYGIAEESTMGERLAWVCLLCEAKKKGRGGKVSVRKTRFISDHRLSGRSVDGMLTRAQKCGAIVVNGDHITLCNWPVYQEKRGGRKASEPPDSPRSAPPITHHQPPITKTSSPSSTQGSIQVGPLPRDWLAAAAALREEGVRKADEACQAAIANGCSSELALAVICHYRGTKPRWDAQDLYFRIIDLRPGDDFTARWREPKSSAGANGYKQLTTEEFNRLYRAGKFKSKPTAHGTKPGWWYGELKDGTKVQCGTDC
jgi:hypothetical protein